MAIKSRQEPLVGATESESVLSLSDVLAFARKRLWVIALAMIMGAGIAIGYSVQEAPQYEAYSTMLIGQETAIVEGPGNVGGLVDLTSTMAYAVRTLPVAEETIRRVDPNMSTGQLLGGLSSDPVSGTQFVAVRYRDTDPERARLVANTVAEVFSERIHKMNKIDATTGAVSATVWERASEPAPTGPNTKRDALVGLLAGAILGIGLAFLLEYRDGSWRSPEEAEQITGLPTFGVVPRF
jgi:capsular polysaccharide biosynthesis protein